MWLKVEGFVDRVRGWWRSYAFFGSPSFMLNSKLKALKHDLIAWNKVEFGDMSLRKSSLLRELVLLDEMDGGILDNEGMERKMLVNKELDHLIDLEKVTWK